MAKTDQLLQTKQKLFIQPQLILVDNSAYLNRPKTAKSDAERKSRSEYIATWLQLVAWVESNKNNNLESKVVT